MYQYEFQKDETVFEVTPRALTRLVALADSKNKFSGQVCGLTKRKYNQIVKPVGQT